MNETCVRRVHKTETELEIPLDWLCDGFKDCENGIDEDKSKWKVCGSNVTRLRCYPKTKSKCEELFRCQDKAGTFISFENLCDGVESCNGGENSLCQVSRNRAKFGKWLSPSGDKFAISSCLKGLSLPGANCTTTNFKHPFPVYGVRDVKISYPQESLECKYLYGELYVYSSCLRLCKENAKCKITSQAKYFTCPSVSVKNYILTLSKDNENLVIVRKYDDVYKNDMFNCRNGMCIPFDMVCNLADDCGDFSDELGCVNHFQCSEGNGNTSKELVPITCKCDKHVDCSNFADECNSDCGEQIINRTLLKISTWILGVLAILLNAAVIFRNVRKIPKITSKIALTNCCLITFISTGQLYIGVYLIVVGIVDLHYSDSYCKLKYTWLISRGCITIGVLNSTGVHISLISLSILSMYRFYVVNFLVIAKGIPLSCRVCIAGFAGIVLIIALSIAVVPILTPLNDYFINGVYYHGVPLFIGAPNKQKHIEILERYYGRLRHSEEYISWDAIENLVSYMFTDDHDGVIGKRLGFYGNSGVCLFKYFVTKKDPQNAYTWAIIALDTTCFFTIVISYALLNTVTSKKKRLVKSVRKSTNAKKVQLKGKITLIILTDCLSWLPFLTICLLHYIKIFDGTELYSLYSLLISPLNSIINPVLYDNGTYNCWVSFRAACSKLIKRDASDKRCMSMASYANVNFETSTAPKVKENTTAF